MERARLPAPAVPPDAYDEDYYRSVCAEHERWHDGAGPIGGIYAWALGRLALPPGAVLVDVGCGRGELVALAARAGAGRAIGVEYAEAAVRLARRTLGAQNAGERAEVVHADARALPLPDAAADAVTLLDVVEHLAPGELEAALAEARRVLRPGGRLLVHTFPNRWIYSATYRAQRALLPGRRRTWPRDPRNHLERAMHVNEQTPPGLRRALRAAGFAAVRVTPGEWIYTDFVPSRRARRTYHRLARVPALRWLGIGNLIGEATRP